MKQITSVRVDPELLKKAQGLGINISTLMQIALEKLLKEKKCPTCGKKI